MRLHRPLRSDAVILCCCKHQSSNSCTEVPTLCRQLVKLIRLSAAYGQNPLPHIAEVPPGTVVLIQAACRAALGFVRWTRLPPLCAWYALLSPSEALLLPCCCQVNLAWAGWDFCAPGWLSKGIYPPFHSENQGCFTKSQVVHSESLLAYIFFCYSSPSAASPASPAPTSACLWSPLLECSSPPSPWQLLSCSWWTPMPSLVLQAYTTFLLSLPCYGLPEEKKPFPLLKKNSRVSPSCLLCLWALHDLPELHVGRELGLLQLWGSLVCSLGVLWAWWARKRDATEKLRHCKGMQSCGFLSARCQTRSTASDHGVVAHAPRCQQTSEDPILLVPGIHPGFSSQVVGLRHVDTCPPGPGPNPLASRKPPTSRQMVVLHPCCSRLDSDQQLVGWANTCRAAVALELPGMLGTCG